MLLSTAWVHKHLFGFDLFLVDLFLVVVGHCFRLIAVVADQGEDSDAFGRQQLFVLSL